MNASEKVYPIIVPDTSMEKYVRLGKSRIKATHKGLRCAKCLQLICRDTDFTLGVHGETNLPVIRISKEKHGELRHMKWRNMKYMKRQVKCKNHHVVGKLIMRAKGAIMIRPEKTTFHENFPDRLFEGSQRLDEVYDDDTDDEDDGYVN